MPGIRQVSLSSGADWGSGFWETQRPTACPLERQGQCTPTPGGFKCGHQLKLWPPRCPHHLAGTWTRNPLRSRQARPRTHAPSLEKGISCSLLWFWETPCPLCREEVSWLPPQAFFLSLSCPWSAAEGAGGVPVGRIDQQNLSFLRGIGTQKLLCDRSRGSAAWEGLAGEGHRGCPRAFRGGPGSKDRS